MYVIDKSELKVHHPFLMKPKEFGRSDFPKELNSSISRKHFEIQMSQYSYYVSDLGSKNGTIANGVLLSATPTKYQKETAFTIGSVIVFISDYAMYSEVDLLSKLGLIKRTPIQVDITSISMIHSTI
jgi:pSer/pThr/pTyr-binding forkhead associated (FHA) protein